MKTFISEEKKALLAILSAVILWSTAATVGHNISNNANHLAITLSLITGGIVFFYLLCLAKSGNPFRKDKIIDVLIRPRLLLYIISFALFITTYYTSFYFSIQNLNPVKANLVNYLWPMLFPLFWVFIFRKPANHKSIYDVFLLALSAIGAFLTIWEPGLFSGEWSIAKYWPAFIAAISAGMYLCFIQSRPALSTEYFYLYGLSFSLIVFLVAIVSSPLQLKIDTSAIPSLIYLGGGVFGAGQYLLNYSLEHGNKLSISAAAYLVPVLSTAFLVMFGHAEITNMVVLGGGLVIASRVLLDEAVSEWRAPTLGVMAVLVLSIITYVTQFRGVLAGTYDFSAYFGLLFSILAGFILGRLWDKNREEDKIYSEILHGIRDLITINKNLFDNAIEKKEIDNHDKAVRDIIDQFISFECSRGKSRSVSHLRRIKKILKRGRRSQYENGFGCVEKLVDSLLTARSSRLGAAEMAVVYVLGIGTVASLLVSVPAGTAEDVMVIWAGSIIAFVIGLIRDQNNNVGVISFERLEPLETLRAEKFGYCWIPKLIPVRSLDSAVIREEKWHVGYDEKVRDIYTEWKNWNIARIIVFSILSLVSLVVLSALVIY